MLFMKGCCPHCGEKSGFRIFALSEYTCDRPLKSIVASQINEPTFCLPSQIHNANFFSAGTCCHCGGPVLLSLNVDSDYLFALKAHIEDSDKRYNGPLPEIVAMWPEPVLPYSHYTLPERVNSSFIDLQNMLKQGLSAHFIIGGCRAVLEEAVKELGGKGNDLIGKIKDLRDKAIVQGVLEEWAHAVRIEGNEAMHELEGTPEEAAEIVEFTKLFLQYTFEFPARVKEGRQKKLVPDKGKGNA